MEKEALFEKLAAIEHERWADWQKYLHSKCKRTPDGDLIIPAGYVESLEKLSKTSYSDLSEEKKDSDREEVKKYWDLINTIPRARAIMREALKADEGFRLGYIANIGMVLYDEVGMDQKTRYDLAKKILKRIFE